MKRNIITLLGVASVSLFLAVDRLPAQDLPPKFEDAYTHLKEAYQAREAGRSELPRKNWGRLSSSSRR